MDLLEVTFVNGKSIFVDPAEASKFSTRSDRFVSVHELDEHRRVVGALNINPDTTFGPVRLKSSPVPA